MTNDHEEGDAHQRELLDQEQGSSHGSLAIESTRPDNLKSYLRSDAGAELGVSFLILVAAIGLEVADLVPHQRPIPYQLSEATGEYIVNQYFNEAFLGETVSGGALILFGMLVPLGLQMLLSWSARHQNHLHRTACVYMTAMGLNLLLTNAIKYYVGYLRPIFYDICVPDETYETCLGSDDDDDDDDDPSKEARKSFVSGHASIAFCGLGLLSFYLEKRFGLSGKRILRVHPDDSGASVVLVDHQRPLRWWARPLSILCHVPLLGAGFIAASRVRDNKHFPADVVGGSVLGFAVARWIHDLWYPSWPSFEDQWPAGTTTTTSS